MGYRTHHLTQGRAPSVILNDRSFVSALDGKTCAVLFGLVMNGEVRQWQESLSCGLPVSQQVCGGSSWHLGIFLALEMETGTVLCIVGRLAFPTSFLLTRVPNHRDQEMLSWTSSVPPRVSPLHQVSDSPEAFSPEIPYAVSIFSSNFVRGISSQANYLVL